MLLLQAIEPSALFSFTQIGFGLLGKPQVVLCVRLSSYLQFPSTFQLLQTKLAQGLYARGSPSRRVQMGATPGAFVLVTEKSGLTACPRSMKRVTASYLERAF